MRKQFCDALLARAQSPEMVFLTGDLGFMALEPLQERLAERFINAGVAEQNMVTVAAGMARLGLDVWAYSIAPFCYARPFEQIRNDVAFHKLPVKLVGNGGGYGYGVMGPTHHAIEDYGILLTLPAMKVFVPVFDEDVPAVIDLAGDYTAGPAYLRLGRGEPPAGWSVPDYSTWRLLVEGDGPPVVAVGPLAGTYIAAIQNLPQGSRPALWALAELPVVSDALPAALLASIKRTGRIVVAEEHVQQGGVGSQLAMCLLGQGVAARLTHLFAKAHHYERYGSQSWLREQSGLDAKTLLALLEN
ncbi:transketolase [Silvimonas terrae]|uniref:Transketolase n=1 Tax=Silvimonas terrae TaxID=300266 RepID=A0A840RJF7_9NEIS|nr:transketolase [Silvimonas terrae]MBB5192353.1 transketolase [Silvimonas terrae]